MTAPTLPTRPGREAAGFAFSSPAEAVSAMLARVQPVGTERVVLDRAAGRVLAEGVVADRPSPAADVSAMDGYAVRLADLAPGRHRVAGEVRIGFEPPRLHGGVVRIVTGGAVPAGADAVIKREDVRELSEAIEVEAETIARTRPGQHIRRRGENARPGDEVVAPGRVIDAPTSAALATFGVTEPVVHRRVRIGVLVTGDEVVSASEAPSPWQLRDSNGPALAGLLSPVPWAEVVGPRRAGDDLAGIQRAVEALLGETDALLMTGGVSMGDRDFVQEALAAAGAEILFHRIPQRPGKPVLGAIAKDGQPVLALPGNPVSVMVTARRMAWPALMQLAGARGEGGEGGEGGAPALVTLDPPPASDRRLDLWWQRLVRVTGAGRAALVAGMGSGDLVSAARSDGFVEMPPGATGAGPWPFYAWRPL